jgi:predicted  nucleic acid-binding Zn-ribbon protein
MNTVSENSEKIIEEEILVRLLLEKQPHSKNTLESLRRYFANRNGHGAFAPIKGGQCRACHLSIAQARLQQAKNGMFIVCSNCARFLYWAEVIPAVSQNAPQPE